MELTPRQKEIYRFADKMCKHRHAEFHKGLTGMLLDGEFVASCVFCREDAEGFVGDI